MKKILFSFIAAAICTAAFAQNESKLAATPQMGWSSWNKFAFNINEKVLKETADKMVELGLVDLGYVYLNIDDGWHGERDEQGFIQADPEKFPKGMKELTDYFHSKGLKAGIYSDAGRMTCGCKAGSQGHEYQDAYTYASWGFDYLKYDWCFTENVNPQGAYKLMRAALDWAGRPIFFSMCEWGQSKPWEWAAGVGDSWRSTGDISNTYADQVHPKDDGTTWTSLGFVSIVDLNEPLRAYAGPGHWNDPDMLEVGNGMTVSEDRAHFTLWCMMAAPLILGNDLMNMSDETMAIITNREAIAIDQDPLGIQGFRKEKNPDGLEYWYKPLENGDWAVCVFNRSEEEISTVIDWKALDVVDSLNGRSTDFENTLYNVKDLWNAAAKPVTTKKNLKVVIPSHDVVLYRLTPKVNY